uniref:Gamma-glutamyltransferase n=1 Tax=Romanomermis culicivorax TaxID=13658 RepID=A0A915L054_ROMCU
MWQANSLTSGINGTRTLSSVAQTIINIVKFGMDPKTAIDAPKIYCDRDSCEIERFDGVESLVHALKIETGVENFQIVEEKLAGIGVASKSQTKVQAYFESSIDGKASQY